MTSRRSIRPETKWHRPLPIRRLRCSSTTTTTSISSCSAATDGLTGDFQGTFTNLIESVIIPGAKEKVADRSGSRPGRRGSLDAEADSATTMLFLNQITTSSESPEAVASGSRVKMSLEKQDGRWLVNNVQPF